jgi:hypothetical protein
MKVERYEHSDVVERTKVALRFTDCIVGWPRSVTPELRADLRKHFTSEEIVELALDVMKWSNQKIRVALGLDAVAAGNGRSFEIGPDGAVTVSEAQDAAETP